MIKRKWNPCLTIVILSFLAQLLVMTLWRDHSFVSIHDNLDLFIAHNKMMKDQGIFFAKDGIAPMLGGISRNLLGSEFFLFNFLFYIFPPYTAYVSGYFLKIAIGFLGVQLLAKEYYREKYEEYRSLLWLIGAGFGMIPVFPAYGICFTSLPLLACLLLKIVKTENKIWYLGLFVYPVLSYFSYFGFFILGFMVLGLLGYWLIKKRFSKKIFFSIFVLFLGYFCFEYRLFMEMLFSHTVTIREEMVPLSLSFAEVVKYTLQVMAEPGFHAEDSHRFILLPVTAFIMVWYTLVGQKKKKKEFPRSVIYFVFGWICFNCLICGLYEWEPFRTLVEYLIPKLKGFQFNRTIFLNPFLWYLLFFFCLKMVWDEDKSSKIRTGAVHGIAVLALAAVMFVPQVYNDFYQNCYHHAYELIKGKPSTQLSFREFYAEDFFTKIKEEIDYQGEWSVAYGMHPAVLQYNQISILDGYLGLYSKEYKDKFRQLIAPALEKSEEFRHTFDHSGIRAYIYSGSGENTYLPLKELEIKDHHLYLDTKVFEEMGGKYIFSRIKIDNEEELGLELYKTFTEDNQIYTIYVYKLKNRGSAK